MRRIADRLSAGPASVASLAATEAKLQQTDRGIAARLILEALRRLGAASREGNVVLDLRIHIFLPKIGLSCAGVGNVLGYRGRA